MWASFWRDRMGVWPGRLTGWGDRMGGVSWTASRRRVVVGDFLGDGQDDLLLRSHGATGPDGIPARIVQSWAADWQGATWGVPVRCRPRPRVRRVRLPRPRPRRWARSPGMDQIPQGFVRRVRYPYRRQIAGPIASGQALRVPPIGLDSVTGLHGHQRRGDPLTLHSPLHPLPIQRIASRPSLIAGTQLPRTAKLPDQLAHRLHSIGDHPQAAHLPAARLRHRHRDRLRMDIQPNQSYVLHGRLPFVCGSAPRSCPTHSVIRDAANREPVIPL